MQHLSWRINPTHTLELSLHINDYLWELLEIWFPALIRGRTAHIGGTGSNSKTPFCDLQVCLSVRLMQIHTNILFSYSITHTCQKDPSIQWLQFYATLRTIVGKFNLQIHQKSNTYVRVNVRAGVHMLCRCIHVYLLGLGDTFIVSINSNVYLTSTCLNENRFSL